jgi:hypothetical protein
MTHARAQNSENVPEIERQKERLSENEVIKKTVDSLKNKLIKRRLFIKYYIKTNVLSSEN